jgi:hypothetical protein
MSNPYFILSEKNVALTQAVSKSCGAVCSGALPARVEEGAK